MIVVGPPAGGKSTIVQAVVDVHNAVSSSNTTGRSVGTIQQQHKLWHIFPLATDDLTRIFGSSDSNGKWNDGIFTATWKKASRVSDLSC